jgi:hypothetical protein
MVLSDVPVRTGYVAALISASGSEGLVGRVEAGYRFLPELAGFAYGQGSTKLGWSAGAGVKLRF